MDSPSRTRTRSSGTAICPGSGSGSTRPGARSTSSRAGGRAASGGCRSAGTESLPPTRRRRQAAAVIDRIKRGEDPDPGAAAPPLTVADLAERYMEAHAAVKLQRAHAGNLPGLVGQPHPPGAGEDADRCGRPVRRVGSALRDARDPARGEPGVDGAVQDVFAGRGLGAGPVRRQSVPLRAPLQGGQAGAVPHTGRVSADRPRAACAGGRGPARGACRGGAAAADADRMPGSGRS